MADISVFSAIEEENVKLDELSLSGESGQYINKLMCAMKKAHSAVQEEAKDLDLYTKTGIYQLLTGEASNVPEPFSGTPSMCYLAVVAFDPVPDVLNYRQIIQIAVFCDQEYILSPVAFLRVGGIDGGDGWGDWSQFGFVS